MAERLERDRGIFAVVAGRDRLRAMDLPSVFTTFVGRDADLALIGERLVEPSTRLVTLVGPGGVGKTRLALRLVAEVADGFPDGVTFVSLGTTRSPNLVPDVVRHALGIVSDADRTPTEQVLTALRDRRALVVLDGFEHLMTATAFVSRLVDECPGIGFLVTSRRRLRLAAEQVHLVRPLALPDVDATPSEALASEAVRLFMARAAGNLDGSAPRSGDVALVGDICRHLDGLPLAIELTAARMRLLSLADIASMLERHVPIDAEGPTDAPDRLRSLRASVAWSYDLLASDRQRLLRWLAVFDGSASLAAAESMSGDDEGSAPVLEMLDDIVELGLMTRSPTIGRTRFSMLQTVREVMLEYLDLERETDRARASHARYCLALAMEAEVGLRATGQRTWLVEMELELANMRAAVDWYLAIGEPDTAAQISFSLVRFWFVAGHLRDARDTYRRVTGAPRLSDTWRTRCLAAWALLEWNAGDMVSATARYADAAATIDGVTDPTTLAYAAWAGTLVLGTQGKLADARHLAERARAGWASLGDAWYLAAADWALGIVELLNGNPGVAEALHRHALEIAEPVPDALGIAIVRTELGIMMLARGDAHASLIQVQGALADSLAYRVWMHVPLAIETIAAARAGVGDPTGAMRLMGAADEMRRRMGSVRKPALAWMTDPIRAMAYAQLGAPAADAALRAGRQLSEDDAIAEALLPADMSGAHTTERPRRVSTRELEVLALVADGRSDQQIAETLHISTKTASKHVASVLEKLGASNRTGAAVTAIRRGLI